MEAIDIKKYQPEPNGHLTQATRDRIGAARDRLGLTWHEVGQRMGFSGGFARFLAIGTDQQGRVRTKHVERVVRAIEQMEAEAGLGRSTAPSASSEKASAFSEASSLGRPSELLSLQEIISQLHQYGFEVSLRPLQSK